jgi:hypothetical protein
MGLRNTGGFMAEQDIDQDVGMLQLWLKITALGGEVPVILFVKGATVSGTLVSGREYLREISSQIRNGSGNVNEIMADAIDNAIASEAEQAEREDDDEDRPRRSVYLKDARIVVGGQVTPIGPWSGRVASVDGFSLGLFNDQR